MPVLLTLFVVYLMMVQTFALDIGLGPGLSLKNGILYLLFAFLLMRFAVRRNFRLQMGGVFGGFAVLLGYAIASTVAIMLFIQYPGYKFMTALTQFKGLPFDFLAMFFVFFYGLQTRRDVRLVLVSVLAMAVFANVVSGLDALGIVPLETIEVGETSDRVQGVMAEHNQYGAFIAFFIPLLVAAVVTARRWRRLLWLAGTLISFGLLLMTVSRGAFIGLLLGGVIGAMIYRRYVLGPRVVVWLVGGSAIAVLVIIGVLFGTNYGSTLVERVLGGSGTDMWQVSSGRTELWADALGQMMRTPVTLITGFGWASYFVLPSALPLAPHNTYLWYWFELGIVGVLAFIVVLVSLGRAAIEAANLSSDPDRPWFIGFTVALLALAIAIFFVEIYTPWPFIWAATGAVMRLAMIVREERRGPDANRITLPIKMESPRADSFGWTAPPVRRNRGSGAI
jgi:O-antigen ligase